jgi:omega-6 fatty acid desaturase (delta-12 desaturase)
MKLRNASSQINHTDNELIRKALAKHQHPDRWKGIWQLVNTLPPYSALFAGAVIALKISFWLSLPVILLASGFLIRTFIIFHDCGHGSFFKSKRANTFWGIVTGIITFTPYHYWHANHARHHATSGNLSKRGYGDVWMLTVKEYAESSRRERLKYRFYRNPIVMFFLGPLFILLITHRFARRKASRADRISIYVANIGSLVSAAALIALIGWKAYLIVQGLILYFGLVCGVWLFYVQHQYEEVYWSRDSAWDFVKASLEGSSFYDLPRIFRWFTGNIGYHHIHHLNPRVPNYRLVDCHGAVSNNSRVATINLAASLKSLRLHLWDEETGCMISFRRARQMRKFRSSGA